MFSHEIPVSVCVGSGRRHLHAVSARAYTGVRVGVRHPEFLEQEVRKFSILCWPVCPSRFSTLPDPPKRSTERASFMNWGRAPTTCVIRIWSRATSVVKYSS